MMRDEFILPLAKRHCKGGDYDVNPMNNEFIGIDWIRNINQSECNSALNQQMLLEA
jgi:hypothetical protein